MRNWGLLESKGYVVEGLLIFYGRNLHLIDVGVKAGEIFYWKKEREGIEKNEYRK